MIGNDGVSLRAVEVRFRGCTEASGEDRNGRWCMGRGLAEGDDEAGGEEGGRSSRTLLALRLIREGEIC